LAKDSSEFIEFVKDNAIQDELFEAADVNGDESLE